MMYKLTAQEKYIFEQYQNYVNDEFEFFELIHDQWYSNAHKKKDSRNRYMLF